MMNWTDLESSSMSLSEVVSQGEDFLESIVSVRGYLLVFPGRVVSEQPLEIVFDSIIVELENDFELMFCLTNRADYEPSRIITVEDPDFFNRLNKSFSQGMIVNSQFLYQYPVVVSGTLLRSKLAKWGSGYQYSLGIPLSTVLLAKNNLTPADAIISF